MENKSLNFREEVSVKDLENVKLITASTGFFHDYEIDTAVEIVKERLDKGIKSGYNFIFSEYNNKTVGFTSFGHIACTKSSYDLYWIAISNDCRGQKIGSNLLKETEQKIASFGGKNIYAETSSKPQYESTRQFYLKNGYIQESILKDFYDLNDSKVTFVKTLGKVAPEHITCLS
ncbi:MAG: GNAT family N-acetyltransferase [Pseudomonadota bacterium]